MSKVKSPVKVKQLIVYRCKWCGEPTLMAGIYVCLSCQDLQVQVMAQPKLAQKMLDALT